MTDTQRLSADQLMPWEKTDGVSESDAVESLFEALGSDPEFEDPEEAEQPSPAEEEEAGEPEDEEAEEADEDEGEFEDEEEEGEEEDEEPAAPATYEINVDGEKVRVTLEELQAGYSRTSDYTRKTQALAEKERTELAGMREARDQYAQRLEVVEGLITDATPPEPDWDKLRKENPGEFAAQFAEAQQRKDNLAVVQAERQRVAREQAEEWQGELRARVASESVKLVEAIPEWKDETAAVAGKKALANYLQNDLGFTPEDLSSVVDHRLMLLSEKARRYDEMMSKKAGDTKVIETKVKVAKVLPPGGRPRKARKGPRKEAARAMDRLRRSGSVEDAQAALLGMMGEDD